LTPARLEKEKKSIWVVSYVIAKNLCNEGPRAAAIAKFFGDDVSPYVVVQREEFRPLGLHKRSIRDALQVGELNSTNNRADIFATSIRQRGSLWYE